MADSYTRIDAARLGELDRIRQPRLRVEPVAKPDVRGAGSEVAAENPRRGAAARDEALAPLLEPQGLDGGIPMREPVERRGACRDSFNRSHRSHLGSTKPASRRGGWESSIARVIPTRRELSALAPSKQDPRAPSSPGHQREARGRPDRPAMVLPAIPRGQFGFTPAAPGIPPGPLGPFAPRPTPGVRRDFPRAVAAASDFLARVAAGRHALHRLLPARRRVVDDGPAARGQLRTTYRFDPARPVPSIGGNVSSL